jgi:hypothetical protein
VDTDFKLKTDADVSVGAEIDGGLYYTESDTADLRIWREQSKKRYPN